MSHVNPVNKSYCLEQICESNYEKLLTLFPEIPLLNDAHIGHSKVTSGLHISLLSVSPFTTTIELNHRLLVSDSTILTPSIQVRLYLDIQLAEVLNDNDREHVHKIYKDNRQSTEILQYKWELNYFLHKWLDYCFYKQNVVVKVA